MSSILLTGPAVEPLSLADAKAYLRVAHDDDDDVIGVLIASARGHIEARTRRALITQTWRIVRDAWPADGRIAVTPAPLQEIAQARVFDIDGAAQVLDLQAFVLDTAAAPAIVSFAPWAMPAPGRAVAGIEIDVVVGYGDAAADVPEPLILAIRMLLAHWYEHRGVIGANAALPAGVPELIAPYRALAL